VIPELLRMARTPDGILYDALTARAKKAGGYVREKRPWPTSVKR
jgi:hypothetical protein